MKSEWLDHRLRANLAGFVSNYSALQLPVATVDPGTGFPAFLTESVGYGAHQRTRARNRGSPGGWPAHRRLARLSPLPHLESGRAAYNPITNPGGPTLSDVPALTPTWKGNVGAQYALPLGGAGTLTPRLDYTYQSKVFNDPQDELISMQAGYGLLNARLTWEALKEAGKRHSPPPTSPARCTT